MIDPNREKIAREDNDSDKKGTAMTDKSQLKNTVEITIEYLDALRRAVGLQIDPETAEVDWAYRETLDPYGDGIDLPEEFRGHVGREYFARSPGSDIWISFGDLPEATRNALSGKCMPSLSIGGRRQHSP
jgi:hypothetical protein